MKIKHSKKRDRINISLKYKFEDFVEQGMIDEDIYLDSIYSKFDEYDEKESKEYYFRNINFHLVQKILKDITDKEFQYNKDNISKYNTAFEFEINIADINFELDNTNNLKKIDFDIFNNEIKVYFIFLKEEWNNPDEEVSVEIELLLLKSRFNLMKEIKKEGDIHCNIFNSLVFKNGLNDLIVADKKDISVNLNIFSMLKY